MRVLSRVLLCIALMGAASGWAESLLIAVSETIDGVPISNPLPAAEGIFDGLFEAGHIVFDVGSGKAIPPIDDLADMARSGGAEYVLEGDVSFITKAGENGREITATAELSLVRAGNVTRLGTVTLTDTNKGREKDVDLPKLGFELGVMIAERVNGIIASRGGS
jgi:hypothetical protein